MLDIEQDDSSLRVHYRSYRLALVLLILPPLILFEHVPALLDNSIETSDLAALILGVVLPLFGAYLLIEFASFSFSLRDNRFTWRWRNLLRRKSLDDGSIIGLTRSYSGIHDRKLDQIVDQIREYLGHVVPMR